MNVYLLKIEVKSFRHARQDIVRIQKVIWDHLLAFNPFSAKDVLIDFTLSNARRFYSSRETPWH